MRKILSLFTFLTLLFIVTACGSKTTTTTTTQATTTTQTTTTTTVKKAQKNVKLGFYLPDLGGNEAYVSGSFNSWNQEGLEEYKLTLSKSEVNLYVYDGKVDEGENKFEVIVLDSKNTVKSDVQFNLAADETEKNYTVHTFDKTIQYRYDGTLTVAPYKIYDKDGAVVTELTDFYNNKDVVIQEFDSMYSAIHYAGTNSTTNAPLSVKDANGLEVFKRQSKSQYFMYDGDYFVGSAKSSEAIAWGETKSRSYVVDGQGKGYQLVGRHFMNGSQTDTVNFELFSGGYNYMYSKSGEMKGDNWVIKGFGYMTVDCNFSEAMYMPPTDGDGWNAYLFVNPSAGYNCDLGLIGNYYADTNTVKWRMVRNCSHEDHKTSTQYGPSFTTFPEMGIVTEMHWDEEKQCYTGADDLNFEVIQTVDGFTLNLTNLGTGKVYTIKEHHKGMLAGKEGYMRFLLAASLCPVRGNLWNARSGAYIRNIVYQNIKVARYNESNDYRNAELLDFYPGRDTISHGFYQAGDCASYEHSFYKTGGILGKGDNAKAYKAGDEYLSYSSFYDGKHE